MRVLAGACDSKAGRGEELLDRRLHAETLGLKKGPSSWGKGLRAVADDVGRYREGAKKKGLFPQTYSYISVYISTYLQLPQLAPHEVSKIIYVPHNEILAEKLDDWFSGNRHHLGPRQATEISLSYPSHGGHVK